MSICCTGAGSHGLICRRMPFILGFKANAHGAQTRRAQKEKKNVTQTFKRYTCVFFSNKYHLHIHGNSPSTNTRAGLCLFVATSNIHCSFNCNSCIQRCVTMSVFTSPISLQTPVQEQRDPFHLDAWVGAEVSNDWSMTAACAHQLLRLLLFATAL